MKIPVPKFILRAGSRMAFRAPKFRHMVWTAGLATAAILIGIVFYAQAGLLTPEKSKPTSREQSTGASETVDQPEQPTTLGESTISEETQPSTVPTPASPKPAQPQNTPSPAKDKTTGPSCDEAAKAAAEKIRKQARLAEDRLHRKKISNIGLLSKVLSMAHLAKDKVAVEQRRHASAIEAIQDKYEQSIEAIHCKK